MGLGVGPLSKGFPSFPHYFPFTGGIKAVRVGFHPTPFFERGGPRRTLAILGPRGGAPLWAPCVPKIFFFPPGGLLGVFFPPQGNPPLFGVPNWRGPQAPGVFPQILPAGLVVFPPKKPLLGGEFLEGPPGGLVIPGRGGPKRAPGEKIWG